MPGLARGCPQRLAVTQARASRPTSILAMGLDTSGNYLAILTRHDLQVWHGGQHNVLLGHARLKDAPGDEKAERKDDDAESEDDPFVKPAVVWSRSSEEICVLGLDGCLTFFSVAEEPDVAVYAGVAPPEWMDLPPGDGGFSPWLDSPTAVTVTWQRTLEDVRGTCLTAGLWAHHLLIGKDKEPALLDLSWSGTIAAEYQLRGSEPLPVKEDEEEEGPTDAILVHLDYSDVCHLLVAVQSDGRALVCNVPSPNFSVLPVPVPTDLSRGTDVIGAVEVAAFSPVDAVLAVGYDDGSVAIYRVLYANTYSSPTRPSRTPQLPLRQPSLTDYGVVLSHSRSGSTASDTGAAGPIMTEHVDRASGRRSSSAAGGIIYPTGGADEITLVLARRLSLDSLGFEIRHVGPVLTMEFSPDGGSLAVGHGWHSLNVWDTSQWCRPMTTFPRVPQTPTETPSLGIACIVWGYRGYRLLVAQNELVEHGVSGSIIRYELLKWARHAAMADTALCLQGVGSVALLEQRPWNPRLLSWAHINVPPAYAVNLPVALVAVSPSTQHVAIAGKRGFALYNQSQRKWRLFGNVHQERELQVAGLAWWREDVVVVVAKQKTAFVLLLYPRTHLDKSSLLNHPDGVSLPPGTRPLFLDCVLDGPEQHRASDEPPPGPDGTPEATRSERPPSLSSTSGAFVSYPASRNPSLASTVTPASFAQTTSFSVPNPAAAPTGPLPSATLLVGDATFLLVYRLTKDPGSNSASITFLYDLKMPVHRGPRSHGEEAPPSPASSVRSAASSTTHRPPPNSTSAPPPPPPPLTPQQRHPLNLPFGEAPRRVILLPNMQPRAVALLTNTASLYKLELGTGCLTLVATGVSNLWELQLPCLGTQASQWDERLRPCYLLYCGDNGFSLWLPSLRCDKALELTLEACRSPFLEPTFNPDVEGVLMGLHAPTNSLIFLTQTCLQPQMGPVETNQPPIPPRFQVGLQRRPIYQVVFRYLLFLQTMLRGRPQTLSLIDSLSHTMDVSGTAELTLSSKSGPRKRVDSSSHQQQQWVQQQAATAELVHSVVVGIFDELYAHPETRIHLADALDFLVRSCIEAVAIAHARMKRKTASKDNRDRSPFTSLATAIEQVREALLLCRREVSLTLFYEVIVRVARKVEPSRQKYIFPLPDLDGQGVGDTPVSLFDKCLRARKLHTAILYLPLIEAHYVAASPTPTPNTNKPNAVEESEDESLVRGLKLVHSLALKLLWECLRRGRRDWRMLKQLWRFINKRQEALCSRVYPCPAPSGHKAPMLHHSTHPAPSPPRRPAPFQNLPAQAKTTSSAVTPACVAPTPTPSSRPLLGLLYRVTVGMLTPSASSDPAPPSDPALSLTSSNALATPLPHTPSTASTSTSSTQHPKPPMPPPSPVHDRSASPSPSPSPPSSPSPTPLAPPTEPLSFHLLRYAETGRDVVTIFCSLCLATLRLKDLVDALLLLDRPDMHHVPYPSLRPFGHRLPDFPWARFEAPCDILLDCFLAIREQFAGGDAAAAQNAAALGAHSRGNYCPLDQRLAILQAICRELRDFECLLALGTFMRDAAVVKHALQKGRVGVNEYASIFLDERLELEPSIRDVVRRVVAEAAPPTTQGVELVGMA